MGQGMDGMNESWDPEDEPMEQRTVLVADGAARLRVEADSLFRRAQKAEEKNKQLRAQLETASNNARLYAGRCTALEAEVERLRQSHCLQEQVSAEMEAGLVRADQWRVECLAVTARAEAAESTAAGLRRALEEAKVTLKWNGCTPQASRCDAALAASPDEHERRLKAEIIQEAADSVPADADTHDWFYMLAAKYKAEADRLEAENGR